MGNIKPNQHTKSNILFFQWHDQYYKFWSKLNKNRPKVHAKTFMFITLDTSEWKMSLVMKTFIVKIFCTLLLMKQMTTLKKMEKKLEKKTLNFCFYRWKEGSIGKVHITLA